MNLKYFKNFINCIYSRGVYPRLFKSKLCFNFGCTRRYSQLNTRLIDESSPLKKITNLSEFVEQRHRSVLKKINDVLQVENISKFSQEQKNILFYSCGKLLSNRSLDLRRRLCDEVFDKIKHTGGLTINDCNTYIEICTENEKPIDDFEEFFKKIHMEPNEETYKLLLENLCEMGKVQKGVAILAVMKSLKYTIDERVFNALVLGNTIRSGQHGGETVFGTMKAAHILETSNTYWNMLKGIASRGNKEEFLEVLSKVTLRFNEGYFMQVLLKLGLADRQECVKELKRKFEIKVIPRNLTHTFDHLCINLIHRAKAKSAIEIYCSLCEANCDGRLLLEEIIKTEIYADEAVIEFAEYLKASGKNKRAIEDCYDLSLRFGKPPLSWALIKKMERFRPHYFWPLILKQADQNGEAGVLDTLTKMRSLNAEIDLDTLEFYAFPHCDLTNPKNLIERMQFLELPLKVVLTPILVLLLQGNKVKETYDLCKELKAGLQGNRMIRALANAWVQTKESKQCVYILKRMLETNESSIDITGSVLFNISKLITTKSGYNDFDSFLKDINQEKILITPAMCEGIQKIWRNKSNCEFISEIEEKLYSLVDMSATGDKTLHPKNMTLQELECHLIELKSKNKETRGVLRRLIQLYAKEGNISKVNESLHLFIETGYEFSPGMKSAVLKSYITSGNLKEALSAFENLRETHPDFNVDHYKIIDLASLMVKSNQFDDAVNFLQKELHPGGVRNPSGIERNCWKLLTFCNDPSEATQIFHLLAERGYCKPTNVILGPIVRQYLNKKDYDGAINFYVNCSKKYNCTPLQLELMYTAIDIKDEMKLREIIEATAQVHGVQNSQMALLAALAEKGLVIALNKLILDIKFVPRHLLELRCKRWVKEGKVDALITLDKAAYRLSPNVLDVNLIYSSIGQIYVNNNNCEGAIEYCQSLVERQIGIPKELGKELKSLFIRNKFKIPEDLAPFING